MEIAGGFINHWYGKQKTDAVHAMIIFWEVKWLKRGE